MSVHSIVFGVIGLVATSMVVASGCATLQKAGVPGMEPYIKQDPAVLEEVKTNREKFALHHDHKALYWLLSHQIRNGMELRDVEEVLGESGEFTNEFTRLKSDGLYQTTDPAYRWGPDNEGHSAILFFRDGRVINFTPKDFRLTQPAKDE